MPNVLDRFWRRLGCVYPYAHPLAGHASASEFCAKYTNVQVLLQIQRVGGYPTLALTVV